MSTNFEENEKYGISVIDRELLDLNIESDVLEILKPAEAMKHKILPWLIVNTPSGNTLRVLAADIEVLQHEREILARTKGLANKVEFVFSNPKHLENAIIHYYNIEQSVSSSQTAAVSLDIVDDEEEDNNTLNLSDERLDDENSPTVRLVNNIIMVAIEKKASDIHFEPERNGMIVRFRIDGTLIPQENYRITERNKAAVLARIKIMAKMDISKKREPQDGQITLRINNNNVDFRVNIVPCINGEKCVLRILDKSTSLLALENMGFLEADIAVFSRVINDPTGVVLLTGPTGAGKSTTLYAFLSRIDAISKNITTVENPVEYQLANINQIQVDEKHVHFMDALRALLRQDPDVVMIGEVRDAETADNMVQAAQTGHLVFSTLHTNDALSSLKRLRSLGVQEDSIAETLSLVISQRLVKRICPHCIVEYTPDFKALGLSDHNIRYLKQGHPKFYRGRGCEHCENTGYSGRTVAYEYFEVDDNLREMVESGKSVYEMRRVLLQNGMVSQWHNALDLVKKNISTIEEVRRAVKSTRDEWKF